MASVGIVRNDNWNERVGDGVELISGGNAWLWGLRWDVRCWG